MDVENLPNVFSARQHHDQTHVSFLVESPMLFTIPSHVIIGQFPVLNQSVNLTH